MLMELTVPHRGEPTATTYSDRADYIARCHAAYRGDGCIYDETTAADLADCHGFRIGIGVSLANMRADGGGWILDIAEKHGWHAPLYRADYLGQSEYSPDRVSEFDACAAWAASDVSGHAIAETAAACTGLLMCLEGKYAPRWGQCGPLTAADVLRKAARDSGWDV